LAGMFDTLYTNSASGFSTNINRGTGS
jgi:hypothetical protein